MTRSDTGLQCHVGEDGSVEVQLAAGRAKLKEEQVTRSPVLSSIADKPGTGLLPVAESAFKCWHRYDTLDRQTAHEAKLVLQTSIFLQDAKATNTAAAYIAQLIRKAVRPASVSLQYGSIMFPSYSSFKLPTTATLMQLITELKDLQQIEAAEISKHLSLVDVLIYAQNSKQESFQSPGLVAGAVNMTHLLQFASPKFTHAFCEASAPTFCHSGNAALQELQLPVRCFTDSNITPLQPIQDHLTSLNTLTMAFSVFLGPAVRQVKPPFTDFLCTLAPHSTLKHLSFEVPDLPEKAKRLADCRPIQKLIKCTQTLTTLTALQLSAPYLTLDSRPTFLTSFPDLVHLHLGMRGLQKVESNQVTERILASLLNLPSTLQSLHLNFNYTIVGVPQFGPTSTSGPFISTHLQLLRSQACEDPMYPHLTHLVFQGPLPMGRGGHGDQNISLFDATCKPGGIVQADVAVCIPSCDAVREAGLKLPTNRKILPPQDPSSSEGDCAPQQELDVKMCVRKLTLLRHVVVDMDGMWGEYLDADDMEDQVAWGGYLYRLIQAAVQEETGHSGRPKSRPGAGAVKAGWEAPTLVGEDAIYELHVRKVFQDLPRGQSLLPGEMSGRCIHANYRDRMVEERAKRANFFSQLALLKDTRLQKLEYLISNFLPDNRGFKGLGPAEIQENAWAAAEPQEEQNQQWMRQTCADGAAEAAPQVGPGALQDLCVDIEGFSDSLVHDSAMLQTICSGLFTGLRSLKLMSKQPAMWVPGAIHRSFVPVLHNLSTLTSLTRLVMQRSPGVCVLVEALSTLTGLEVLSVIGVEHSGDALRELGSYLSKFKYLQRLDLEIQPLGESAHAAVGSQGRGGLLHSAYGAYTRGGRRGFDSEEESEEDQTEDARELADMCGCDAEDLLESESDHEEEFDEFGMEGDPVRMRAAAEFWKRLWHGVGGLPLQDGVSLHVTGSAMDPKLTCEPTKALT